MIHTQPKIKNQWKLGTAIVLTTLLLSLVLTLIRPFEYSTEVKLLIIHKPTGSYDPYLSVKAAERIGEMLGKIIYTSSFTQKVEESGYEFRDGFFDLDPARLRQKWKRAVDVTIVPQTGVMEITTFSAEKELSADLARAISDVLVTRGHEYHGAGESVVVKVIDSPVTSQHPTRPNVWLNSLAGVVLGVIIYLILLFLRMNGGAYSYNGGAYQDTDFSERTVHKIFTPNTHPGYQQNGAEERSFAVGNTGTHRESMSSDTQRSTVQSADSVYAEHSRSSQGSALIDFD